MECGGIGLEVIKSLELNGSLNALTIDVEDWFQVANLQDIVNFKDWDKFESRISLTLTQILNLLCEKNVGATFFVLGWIAERFPALIKQIDDYGHEIATHGYSHRCIYEMNEREFKSDLQKSIELIGNITGKDILGYRAPNYSIIPNTIWAFKILAQCGIRYDSSIFPIKHNRGGFVSAPRFPFIIDLEQDGKLIEFPLSTIRLLGNNFPVAGGAYLRLYPYWFIRSALRKLNDAGKPVIIYIHPWEIDYFQPRLKTNFSSRLKHYGNLALTEQKIKKLLSDFQFASISEVIGLA
ncbi:DUF3473 domain-containing protein [candidate division KSB1 bacterium]|nr:DUF3473 domain-containing protein [candidate division KSB1 bacterium]